MDRSRGKINVICSAVAEDNDRRSVKDANRAKRTKWQPRQFKGVWVLTLAFLALLAFLQESSGNMGLFQGCQRMPMALLNMRIGRIDKSANVFEYGRLGRGHPH